MTSHLASKSLLKEWMQRTCTLLDLNDALRKLDDKQLFQWLKNIIYSSVITKIDIYVDISGEWPSQQETLALLFSYLDIHVKCTSKAVNPPISNTIVNIHAQNEKLLHCFRKLVRYSLYI